MSQYLDQLRAALGKDAEGWSDQMLLQKVAEATGTPVSQVADQFLYKPSNNGQWGNRASASIDSYAANLYGLGEALGSKWAGGRRQANEFDAQVAREVAQNQGAILSPGDIGGIGDAANWVGGLAVDSAPYLAEAAAGGLVARGLMGGTRMALNAARATGDVRAAEAAAAALARGSVTGAVAASYPSSVGDVLSSQRDQNGTMDLGSAAAYGVPYALLNAASPLDRMAARGVGARGLRAMDGMSGVRGGAARLAAKGALMGAEEGLNEAGQEGFNQLGRMAVDPNETFLNERSTQRFGDSFLGGAALGAAGAGLGGWRRSGIKPPIEETPNLLQPRSVPRDSSYELQGYGQADGPLYQNPNAWEPPQGPADVPREENQRGLFSGVNEIQPDGSITELGTDEIANPGQYAASPATPQVPGQSLVPPPPAPPVVPTEQESRAAQIRADVERRKAELEVVRVRGESYGLKGDKKLEFMQQLESLQADGKLTPEEFHEAIVTLGASSKFGSVQKLIDEKLGTAKTKAAAPANPTATKAAATAAQPVRPEHAPGPVTIIRPGEQAGTAGQPAGVAAGAPVAPSPVPQGSPGNLGTLPAAQGAGPVPAPAGAPVASSPAPAPVGVGDNQPAAPVGAPAALAPATKSKLRVVKKGTEPAKPEAKGKPFVTPSRDEIFDNYPDFLDWALKKVGATAAQADVFKMKGGSTERGSEGAGEYAGQTHSNRAISEKHSVSDQTISNWVNRFGPQLKELELLHLVARKPKEKAAEPAAEPELVNDLQEAETDEDGNAEAKAAEAPEDSTPQTSDDAGGSMGMDDGFDAVEDDASNESSGIQIRDRMGSGAEVEANNDEAADKAYKRVSGDTAQAKAKWDELATKDDSAPAWDKLGPAQKAWFNQVVASGKDIEEAFSNVSTSRNEGMRFVVGQQTGNDPNASELVSVHSALQRAPWIKTGAETTVEPALAQRAADRDFSLFAQGIPEAGVRKLRGARPIIMGAASSLIDSPYGEFFKAALHSTSCLFAVDPTDPTKRFGDMAAWPRSGRAISVSVDSQTIRAAVTFPEDRALASGVTSMLAHELTHIMEFAGGVNPYDTNHHVYVYVDSGGNLVPSTTPVSVEAINAFAQMNVSSAPEEEQHASFVLQYALEPIMDLVDRNVTDAAELEEAAYHASAELLPVLVQFYLEYPALMDKYMPQGKAYVESILTANWNAYPGPKVRNLTKLQQEKAMATKETFAQFKDLRAKFRERFKLEPLIPPFVQPEKAVQLLQSSLDKGEPQMRTLGGKRKPGDPVAD